ncbi:MAG: hypothetical protein IJL73_06020 [Lachnospiraceae bacterium]|nr:hypothetical protein [Lachnospiraceae bacterium]
MRGKKTFDILFTILFLSLLLIPLAFTNYKPNQISEIDNAYLPEMDWSKKKDIRQRIADMDNWLNMRIGFRTESLDLYQQINDRLFHILEHPTYMYGKDDWIYFKSSIKNYQHLNLNEKWADDFAGYLRQFNDISKSRGIDFYYLLIPDKETVYPEYYREGINVNGATSLTDQVLKALDQHQLDWFYAYDTLVHAKKEMLVANQKYDAGHWNENGAFASIQAFIEHLRQKHSEIPSLQINEFNIGKIHQDSLLVSRFRIDEDVPDYELKVSMEKGSFDGFALHLPENDTVYKRRYINKNGKDLPKLLVFMDSYLMLHEKFFYSHFSEITFIHRNQVLGPVTFEAFIDSFQPDIVIYENPVRVYPISFSNDK